MRVTCLVKTFCLLFILFAFQKAEAACTQPPVPSISTSGPLTFCNGESVTLTASSGTGYTYRWKKNGSNISGATNQTYVAATTGSYTVVVTVDTCSNTSLPADVTVNPLPNGTLTNDLSICQGTSVTLTAGGGTSYNWSAPNANGNTLTVTPGSTTTYSVSISNSFGCVDVDDVVVTVKPLPLANISVAGSSTLCNGESVNLNASSGAGYTYQWCLNSAPIPGATNQTLTVSTPGNYQVITSLNGCSRESFPTTITVNPLPTPMISNDTTICSGVSVMMQASGGNAYQWNSGGPATADYTVSPTATKTYTVTVTNSFGCSASASTTITVIPLPNANISISGSLTLCSGESVTLNASTGSGYSHQWHKNNAMINGETNASLTANSQGSYHVVVTQNGCSKTSSTQTIIVNPLPIPQVSEDTTTCAGETVTLQASGGTAYQWNSGGPATADYTVSPTTTKIYTVTVTNSFGCSASASTTITVIPLPNANISISGSLTLCSGESVTLNASTGSGYSHLWYKNNALMNGEMNASLSVNSAGNYHAVVTQNGCSKTSATQTITVNPLPIPQVSDDTTTCAGETVILQASGGTAYQWSSGGPATATYVVAPTSTKTYTVTVTNSLGCTASANTEVTVIPLPQAWISAAGSTTLCQGDILNLTTANTSGYIHEWFRNGNLISGASANVYSASQAGDYHVKNTSNGCSAISDTISISVNPLPVTGISNDATICSGDTITLTATGGVFYDWNTGPTTSSITVLTTSTRTYSVTITDGNACSVLESVTVTSIALPNASVSLSGPTTFCADRSLTMTASSGTGYSYQWFNDVNMIPAAVNQALTVTQSGLYSVEVTANGCSKKSGASNVIVNPLPVASASDDATICSGDTIQLYASGGISYQWYNGTINSTIQVAPTSTSNYSVTVSNSFGCTASESVTVSTIARPSAVASPIGTFSICSGETTTLTASTGAGYSYQWMEGISTLNGKTNQTLVISTSGNYHVIVTANGCPKNSNTVQVIVNSLPVVSVNHDTTVCGGSPVTLTAGGGATYKWSTGSTNQSINVAPTGSTTYNVTVTSSQGCSSTGDVFISVIPSPSANITSSGSLTICDGDTVTLAASTGPGYFYQWKNNGLDLAGQTNSSFTTTQSGSYSVVVTAFGCSKASSVQSVTVNSLPAAIVSNDTTVCQGNSADISASGGVSYRWSNGRTTAVNTVSPNQTSTYHVTVTDANGCTDANQVTVNVVALPNAYITTSSSTNLCTGQTVSMNASTGAGYSYEWFKNNILISGATNATYVASQTGSYTVRTTANGCSKTSLPSTVTVSTFLVASISNDTTICAGDTVTLFATGGGSYDWSSGETTASIIAAPTTTKTYSVTVSNGVNCSAVKSAVVTVKPLPNAFILVSGAVTSICEGQAATMTANTGAGLSYQWFKDAAEIIGINSHQYLASDSGSYTVLVTLNGCSKLSPPKNLSINPLPAVSVSSDTTVCAGSPVTMIVSGGTSYQWSTFATDSVYTITTTSPRIYFVTVTNSFGCESNDSVQVNTIPLPTNVNISTTSSTQICDGKSVQLKAGSTNGTEFQWQVDGVDIPGATGTTFDAAKQGNYTLVVTGNGCSKTSSPLFVTVKPTPATPDIVKIGVDTLSSSVTGTNYKWYRDGVSYNVGSQKIRATKSGAYTVVVSENSCSSDTSAPYYFYFTGIMPNDVNELIVHPNPNNGKFEIEIPELMNSGLEIKIFNALGQVVWFQGSVRNIHTNVSFDISHLESGIYFLHLESPEKKFVSRVAVNR